MTLKTLLLTGLGFVLLLLGAIGAFLPVLPTVPFVLAASACFSANPKCRTWLHKSAFFREYIDNYRHRAGLKRSTLAISLTFLWTALLLSMFAISQLWGFVLLSCVGIAVTIHLLCIARPKKRRDHKP